MGVHALQNLPRWRQHLQPTCAPPRTVCSPACRTCTKSATPRAWRRRSDSGVFLEAKLLAGQTDTAATGHERRAAAPGRANYCPRLPANTNLNAILAANTLAQVMPSFVRSALGTLGQVSATSPASFPLPARLMASWKAKATWKTCCAWPPGRFRACRAINCRAWSRPAPPPTAACKPPGSWKSPCATCRTSCRCRSNSSAKNRRRTKTSPERQRTKDPKQKLWRVELAFDMEPLGPLQVQAQLTQGRLSSQLWAERALHRQPDRKPPGQPARAPGDSGLNVGDWSATGHPAPGPKTGLEQRWVDETA